MTEATVETIDLTPDADGWAYIAETFVESIIADVRKSRQTDSRKLLAQVVRIAFQLGTQADPTSVGEPARVAIARLIRRIES